MQELKELVKAIDKHEAVNNQFYQKWLRGPLSIEGLGVFVRNYWEWTFRFPEALAGLVANTQDITARLEYTKILYSEMGNGHLRNVHSRLFEEFCKKLSIALGKPGLLNIENLKKTAPLLAETQKINAWQKETYFNQYAIAAGAQLALEWQAYTMIRKLYEGARNYMALWENQDEFHEACEFFYVHIGEAEKEHKEESIIAANKIIEAGASFEDIKTGFCKNLELIGNFWNAIAKNID